MNRLFLRLAFVSLLASARAAGPGALDRGFQRVEVMPDFQVIMAMAVQADGKILVGGAFTNIQGHARNGLARLNADGSLDASFNPPTAINTRVTTIVLDANGRILVNAGVAQGEGEASRWITRFLADGSVDATFQGPPWLWPKQIILAPDGRIYVSGEFRIERGPSPAESQYYLARLSADGAVDEGYWPPIGAPGMMAEAGMVAMALGGDGRIVLGGMFAMYPPAQGNAFLMRFDSDGLPDLTFNSAGTGVYFCDVLATQADGKVLHGNTRYVANGSMGPDTYAAVLRMNADGSLDTSFQLNSDIPGKVTAIVVQPGGKILAGGGFMTPGRYWKQPLVRFLADGRRDESLVFGEGSFTNTQGGGLSAVVVQPDGKILASGWFEYGMVEGGTRSFLVRLRGDPAYMTKLKKTDTGELEMAWTIADQGKSYRVEASTDLKNWSSVSESTSGSATLEFRAAKLEGEGRFYRLVAGD